MGSIQVCPSHKASEMTTKRHSAACVVENNTSSCLAGWVSPGSVNVHRQCPCLISQIMNEKEADVQRTGTSEPLCEKVFGCISWSLITAKNPGGNQQIT